MSGIRLQLPKAHKVSDAFLIIVLILIGLSLAGQSSKYLLGHGMLKGFVPAFYIDMESSVPTWYSSAALAMAGGLFALIAIAKFHAGDRYRWHWAVSSSLFVLLSIDEVAMIHELPIDPLRERFDAGGLLYYTWVVPGAALVGLVGLCYLRFALSLPRRTRWLLVLAGTLFVGGAIGVEMLSGAQADAFGEENFDYALIVTLEEFLEMLGVVVLIRCLLEYIQASFGPLELRLVGTG